VQQFVHMLVDQRSDEVGSGGAEMVDVVVVDGIVPEIFVLGAIEIDDGGWGHLSQDGTVIVGEDWP